MHLKNMKKKSYISFKSFFFMIILFYFHFSKKPNKGLGNVNEAISHECDLRKANKMLSPWVRTDTLIWGCSDFRLQTSESLKCPLSAPRPQINLVEGWVCGSQTAQLPFEFWMTTFWEIFLHTSLVSTYYYLILSHLCNFLFLFLIFLKLHLWKNNL